MGACLSNKESQIVHTSNLDFNIFKYIDSVGRQAAFKNLTTETLTPLIVGFKLNNLESFLQQIFDGYASFGVSYHNEIHALDVMQMSQIIFSSGMSEFANLSHLDVTCALIAAICHDYKHDGYNNQYHAQIKSERVKLYGEVGVQE